MTVRSNVLTIVLSAICAFGSAFVWTLHACNRSIDPHAGAATDGLLFDLACGVGGIVVGGLLVAASGMYRRFSSSAVSEGTLLLTCVSIYGVATILLVALVRRNSGCADSTHND